MGTPRNEVIGGWPAGNPDDSSWVARSGSRTARGSRISAPSSPRPSGQWWIRLISSSVTPTGMNSASRPPSPITPIAPYCASTSDTADSTMPRSTTSMSRFMPIATTESNKALTRSRVATTACSLTCSSASNSSRPRLGKTDLVVPDSTNLLRYRCDDPNRVRSYGDATGQVTQRLLRDRDGRDKAVHADRDIVSYPPLYRPTPHFEDKCEASAATAMPTTSDTASASHRPDPLNSSDLRPALRPVRAASMRGSLRA